jgi:hypothetical protein
MSLGWPPWLATDANVYTFGQPDVKVCSKGCLESVNAQREIMVAR